VTPSLARSLAVFFAAGILTFVSAAAQAQEEIPPPSGKGRVVVVVSGASGASNYEPPAQQIAQMGYDVILLDGNDMKGSHGDALKAAVQQAQNSPHGLPGKVGVVGFSLGGGEALGYATRWPDMVAVVVAWYPMTSAIRDPSTFAAGIKVPVVMFAGELDTYKDCCLIDKARAIGSAASAAGTPLQLVTYAGAEHDFVLQGHSYNGGAASDSWQRATAALAQYLH
jgi:dienelactone hydrolase